MASTLFPDFPGISAWTPSIGGRRGRRQPSCPAQDRETILNMVTKHFHMHPLIDVPGHRTPAQIYIGAAREIYLFCNHYGYIDTWVYLFNEWYFPDLRYKFNRDMVIGSHATRWANEFTKEWNWLISQEENSNANALYEPSTETWTCGCPSFITSRYMLCKHLVRRSQHRRFGPNHFFIHRRITAPFIQILDKSENCFSTMRLEENVGAPRHLTPAESAALPPMLPDDSDDGNDDDSNNDDIIFGDQIPTTAPEFDQQITTPPQFDTSIVADREQDLLRREERMQQNR
ncbi:hypothetical protein INT45_006480 [Circinella minor]|uniref:SWIM-type domain-containing protein n=1 Tax=Circinella minor TaxID=1195481 RepID=A0A8H7RLR9_9FUNG|nr:hypothetical protein INT45_006480 [Circinella minor]